MRFGLDLLNGNKSASFQLQFHFWKQEEVTGCQIRGIRWVGNESHFVFRQKLVDEDGSVRLDVVMVKQQGLFSPKFGATSSRDFGQSPQNVAVEPGIHCSAYWNRCFAPPQLVLFMTQKHLVSHVLLIIEVSRSHSVGFLWTSDQPDAAKSN
jgi:hypothetical protein